MRDDVWNRKICQASLPFFEEENELVTGAVMISHANLAVVRDHPIVKLVELLDIVYCDVDEIDRTRVFHGNDSDRFHLLRWIESNPKEAGMLIFAPAHRCFPADVPREAQYEGSEVERG